MLTMLAKLNCPNDAFPSFPSKSFSFPDLFSSPSLSSPPCLAISQSSLTMMLMVVTGGVIDNRDDVIDNNTAIHDNDAVDGDNE